jgi:hypothetical protein
MFLHSCEHELMSSANPTRVNEFIFSVTFGCQPAEAGLTICLFQAFKERVLLPIEAAMWPSGRCFFSFCYPSFELGVQR